MFHERKYLNLCRLIKNSSLICHFLEAQEVWFHLWPILSFYCLKNYHFPYSNTYLLYLIILLTRYCFPCHKISISIFVLIHNLTLIYHFIPAQGWYWANHLIAISNIFLESIKLWYHYKPFNLTFLNWPFMCSTLG
jgi:hypothetical protein